MLGRRVYDRYFKLYTSDRYFPNGAKHYVGGLKYDEYEPIDVNYKGNLKPAQVDGLMHVAQNFGGLIEAATGLGKSHLVMAITALYKARTLIICPSKKLVAEMVDKFKEFTNYEPGTYYSDGKNIKDITITTHASFNKDLDKGELKGFWTIIVDEADDKISDMFIESLSKSGCNVLVGLTGTPKRADLNREDLELIYGPHISVGEYAMKPTGITHLIYDRSAEEHSGVDYTNRHTQRESIINNETRSEAVFDKIEEITKDHFLTLVLLDRNLDVEKYSERFPDGIVITGQTKIKDDEKGIERLKKEGGLIIGSIKKMYRGVDIPECDCVVIASPIRFEGTVIQSIGRALRAHPDKNKVDIMIINDSILRSQRYQQTKTCKEEYGITADIVYINK